jgi:hypothetical protein
MLVRPHDRGIDGMFLVGGRSKARQHLECRIPHPKSAPAGEAHENRVPIAVSPWDVAPGRACAQNPKNAVDRSPLVLDRRAALAAVGEKWIEVRHSASVRSPRLNAASLRKAALESFTYEKTVNTA